MNKGESIEKPNLRSGTREKKGGKCKEGILSVGGKYEEAADLKKYHKMF